MPSGARAATAAKQQQAAGSRTAETKHCSSVKVPHARALARCS
jgi:hypothetical protein